jgi:CheY-like chemotaxis protein
VAKQELLMKSDVFFILENAGWPAILLDGSGTILRHHSPDQSGGSQNVWFGAGRRGAIAVGHLAREDAKVDLVISDLVMPGMSGRELVERIRQLSPTTRIL